jgi:hypothetical protein
MSIKFDYDEAMDAFAADAAAVLGYLGIDGGCQRCLDTGLIYAGADYQGRVYDPCEACESTEAEREERDARRKQNWQSADYALLLTLRDA